MQFHSYRWQYLSCIVCFTSPGNSIFSSRSKSKNRSKILQRNPAISLMNNAILYSYPSHGILSGTSILFNVRYLKKNFHSRKRERERSRGAHKCLSESKSSIKDVRKFFQLEYSERISLFGPYIQRVYFHAILVKNSHCECVLLRVRQPLSRFISLSPLYRTALSLEPSLRVSFDLIRISFLARGFR